MFQVLRRSVLAIALGITLVAPSGPLWGASPPALGTLRSAGTVLLDRLSTRGDCTLYSGDRVSTAGSPATVSFLTGDVLVLDRQSRAMFQRHASRLVVNLERGALSFSASAADAARIESDGLTFAGTGSFPSLAELALREDGSVVLAVRRGTVSVGNLRPEPVVVAAGHYLVVGPPTAKEEGQVVGTGAHAKQTLGDKLRTFRIGGLSHTASAAFVVGALGGVTAAAIAIPLATSPAKASPSTP